MVYSLNGFSLEIPDIQADIYSIDPQPSGNAYKILGSLEYVIENKLDGKAQKWRHSQDEDWYIAVLGSDIRDMIEVDDRGTTLEPIATHTLDAESYWDRMVLQRALSDSIRWYLTTYEDFWYHDDREALFYSSPRGECGQYDVYTGFRYTVEFHDAPVLVVSSITSFVEKKSLAELINEEGIDAAEQQYRGRNFRLNRPEPTRCQLHGISAHKTVSSETLSGTSQSVLEYVRETYGEEWASKIDPSEPLVQIQFGDSQPYDTAPSLLNASPLNLDRNLTQAAAMSARERQKAIQNFINRLDFVQIQNESVPVGSTRVKPDTQGEFEYPDLRFGNDTILSINRANETNPSQRVDANNWRWVIRDYLEEFGFWKTQARVPEVVLVHPADALDQAEAFYSDIRDKLAEIGGLTLPPNPPVVPYNDPTEFDNWVSEFGDTVDGVLGLLAENEGDAYHEIIDRFDGLPTQYMKTSTYDSGEASSSEIFNTAVGFAAKMAAYTYGLSDQLAADVIIGLSVAGDSATTATAVLLDGRTGELLYQTERPLSQGTSTVSAPYPIKKILNNALRNARIQFDRPIESIAIHRNGRFGDDELEALSSELDSLEAQEYLQTDLEWVAIEILENHHYRIFSDGDDPAPPTGAYTVLDDRNVLVTTFGQPQIHQGTPSPLQCRIRTQSGEWLAETVGRDIFALSFLDWGSPMTKMKSPLSTEIPKDLNELFEKCSRVRYPPF